MRPAAWWANVGAVAGLAWACGRALGSFVSRRPASSSSSAAMRAFPAGLAAVLTRVPLVSMTTDAVPGAVNGLLGRFAAANAVAFDGYGPPRAHVTGHAGAPRARVVGPHARGPGAQQGGAGPARRP